MVTKNGEMTALITTMTMRTIEVKERMMAAVMRMMTRKMTIMTVTHQ